MDRRILKATLTLFLGLIVQITFAQKKTVTGTVSDTSGKLPGVSVALKGTSVGTETDFEGNYTISVTEGDILVFSYLGYKSNQKKIGKLNTINVLLEEDSSELDEVVIVGYGTQSKRKLTDNIVKLSSDDIADVPTPSVMNSLAGKAAGVQISQTNGKVEGGLNFRIRGQSSISAGSDPLYVLDGIPLINNNESSNGAPTNPLLTLSPNEIESIDILKDASSAAIYGARGANGVVLITTKSGKEGKAKFSVNISSGISEKANSRDWLNAEQYVELLLESGKNGLAVEGWPAEGYVEERLDRYSDNTWREGTYDTDWEDLALVKGYTRDADFSISGGDAKTTYFFSGAYNDTKGIVRGNELNRISSRLNVTHKLTDKFSAGMNLSFSRTNIDRIADDNAFVSPLQAIAQPPISPDFVDGEPFEGTPYANFLLQDKHAYYNTIIRRVTGKVFAAYQFTDNLKFNSDFAYDLYSQTEDSFTGSLAPFQSTNGEAFASNVNTENYIFSNYLSYNKTFGENHDLDVILGTELNKSKRRFNSVTGQQFPTDDFQTISSAAEITAGSGSFTEYAFVSYFTRATYAYKDRYLFKASFRRDGSSRFGSDSRFGVFPAFSAGWILSEENFLAESSAISFLKLRASYGQVGNAEIGNFASRGLFGGVSYNQKPGIAPIQAGNNELSWETSDQSDVAIEYGLFNGVLSGEVAYYVKDTKELLFEQPLPLSSGAPEQGGINNNIGRMKSDGVEFSITSKNIQTNDLKWTTSFNIGTNNNEIIELPEGQDVVNGQNILREGEAVNSLYLIEYAGVDIDNGDALYYLNTDDGNGNLDRGTTNDPNAASRVVAGNPFPEVIAGLTNTVLYKDFDFTMTFQGEWGASIYNGGGRFQSVNGDWFDNQTLDQLDRWQKPGDITNVPQARLGAGNGTSHSTRFLEKGDFVRLRNITLGYSIPKALIDKMGLSKLRLYFSGLNLLTITDYTGYDPESRSDAGGVGQTFYSAPAAKTLSIGLNVTF